MPSFPIEIHASTDVLAVVQSTTKPTDLRRFRIRAHAIPPTEIFDVENRTKYHHPGPRHVVRGLQPGWELVSLASMAPDAP